jgi:hypothetical protein
VIALDVTGIDNSTHPNTTATTLAILGERGPARGFAVMVPV